MNAAGDVRVQQARSWLASSRPTETLVTRAIGAAQLTYRALAFRLVTTAEPVKEERSSSSASACVAASG